MMPMAITMGDASGVGPEIILRRYAAGDLDENVLIYGDAEENWQRVLAQIAERVGERLN